MSRLYFSLLLMFTLLSLNVVGLRSRNKIEDLFLNIDYDIMCCKKLIGIEN